jgi:hypothetical protein
MGGQIAHQAPGMLDSACFRRRRANRRCGLAHEIAQIGIVIGLDAPMGQPGRREAGHGRLARRQSGTGRKFAAKRLELRDQRRLGLRADGGKRRHGHSAAAGMKSA